MKVGALIEETDILYIQQELDDVVDNQDITRVYTNLINGSKNHLRSFVAVLKLNGTEYQPALLEKELFERILAN